MSKVSIYVDVSNLYHNGGHDLRYDELLRFAGRDSNTVQRCTAYCTFDSDRASEDHSYSDGLESFWAKLRQYGIKVHIENVRWQGNGPGRKGKANVDTRMVVDMLTQNNSDTVLLCSGDRDFIPVVEALQLRGTRVEILSLLNSSIDLEESADFYVNGAMLPGVVPIQQTMDPKSDTRLVHGELGSTVTGMCYYFKSEDNFGFMRYLPMNIYDDELQHCIPIDEPYKNLNIVGTRDRLSPYKTAFVHGSEFPAKKDSRPSEKIWKFDLAAGKEENQVKAMNLRRALVSKSTKPVILPDPQSVDSNDP